MAKDDGSKRIMTTHRASLLLVDDIPANIHILAAALDQDYDVRFATSGQGGGAHLLGVLRVLGRDTTLARLKAFIA